MSRPEQDRAQGWRTLSALQNRIEDRIERALQEAHGLSVNEFCALHHLAGQEPGKRVRMQQLADKLVLSQSATTRLVTRMEERALLSRVISPEDRRGIYAEPTDAGLKLLNEAVPTHNAALDAALAEAAELPELTPLVQALEKLSIKVDPQPRSTAP
ncbi:DNA-binding MarR family transcriptional regulator [Thermocatellispora tengchongensis]|uniref:DNA-binding MarR family transcriptional regulator n=1 Tax=Thermocatellispora tengchongensis TaxID=1073253 RepID=A0A840NVE9_9ACTN|nr:MarR family transcriptional regulator [Thermocatellispora tengchongensis]MBB5132754.1 DNA-binding MarR family transcriptional regulator [Thermocatellispora tengchongensis]